MFIKYLQKNGVNYTDGMEWDLSMYRYGIKIGSKWSQNGFNSDRK